MPVQVLADSAYGSGDARADAGHEVVIMPIPLRAAVPGGFTLDDFTVDETAGTITCPNGLIRSITRTRKRSSSKQHAPDARYVVGAPRASMGGR